MCLISVTASVRRIPPALAGNTLNYLIGPSQRRASGCHGAARAGGNENKGAGGDPHGYCKEGAVSGSLQGATPPASPFSPASLLRRTKTCF